MFNIISFDYMAKHVLVKYPTSFKKQHKQRFIRKKRTHTPLISCFSKKYPRTNLSASNQLVVPRTLISFNRKTFRRFCVKKKITLTLPPQYNFLLTSKGKNARMGKGVGTYNLYSMRVLSGGVFAQLSNISSVRGRKIARYLTCRSPQKLIITH